MTGKSLMTQYLEGSLVSRELEDMMRDSIAEARFERELQLLDVAYWMYTEEGKRLYEQLERENEDVFHNSDSGSVRPSDRKAHI